MKDRELLEMAAKAAGYEVDSDCDRLDVRDNSGAPKTWNPLRFDGDALRLAVKLSLLVNIDPTDSQAGDGRRQEECELHSNSDAYAATRRAIVRAAAEIGRAM